MRARGSLKENIAMFELSNAKVATIKWLVKTGSTSVHDILCRSVPGKAIAESAPHCKSGTTILLSAAR